MPGRDYSVFNGDRFPRRRGGADQSLASIHSAFVYCTESGCVNEIGVSMPVAGSGRRARVDSAIQGANALEARSFACGMATARARAGRTFRTARAVAR